MHSRSKAPRRVALAASLRDGARLGSRHLVVLGGGNVGSETLRELL